MNNKNEVQKEKIRQQDHDSIIRIEGDISEIKSDIREMKDGIKDQIMDHEVRLKNIEKDHQSIGGTKEAYERLLRVENTVHDFEITFKSTIKLVVVSSSAITFLLTTISLVIGIITGIIRFAGM